MQLNLHNKMEILICYPSKNNSFLCPWAWKSPRAKIVNKTRRLH